MCRCSPQAATAGSLTPQCLCRICWGARVVRAGMLSENRTDENAKFSSGRNSQNCFASGPVPASVAPNFPGVIASWFAVAPVPDCPGALRRVKGPLRRCAPLTRPARSRCFAITGATGTSGVRFLVGSQHAGAYLATTRPGRSNPATPTGCPQRFGAAVPAGCMTSLALAAATKRSASSWSRKRFSTSSRVARSTALTKPFRSV